MAEWILNEPDCGKVLIGEVRLHEYLPYFVAYKRDLELIEYGMGCMRTYHQEYHQQVQQLETNGGNLALPGPKLVEIEVADREHHSSSF